MIIVKFHDNIPDFEYTGKYVYQLYHSTDEGIGLYAPLNVDKNKALLASSICIALSNDWKLTKAEEQLEDLNEFLLNVNEICPGAFVAVRSWIDESLYDKSTDLRPFLKFNETLTSTEWTSSQLTSPRTTVGSIISNYSANAESLDAIKWLISNGSDEICIKLAWADNYKYDEQTGCGCNKVYTGSSCSALEVYQKYMNAMTINSFKDIDLLHEIFYININGNELVNQELITKLKSFLQTLADNSYKAISHSACPCAEPDYDTIAIINNAIKALEHIESDELCSDSVFVSYWLSKLIEKVIL